MPALDRQAALADPLEDGAVAQDPEGRHRGRGGHPVAGVRPAVADVVGQDVHDLGPAAEGGRRVAVAHRLGEGGQVRGHPEELGGPAPGEPEAGLDLVEDEQAAELLGERPHALVEALPRQDRLGVAQDRLDDHGGDVLALALEDPAKGLQIVERDRDDGLGDLLGDTPAPGQADRVVTIAELRHVVRPDADQGVVVDAVVLALELHDLRAAGEAARDPHRVHRALGPRDGHPDLLDPAGQLLDELSGQDLVLAGEAEADAPPHPLVDVIVDPLVGVAEDDRAVAHPEVDELVAVEVPDVPALAPIDVDRVLAPGPEVGIGAARQGLERPPVHLQLAIAPDRRNGGGRGLGGHDPSVGGWSARRRAHRTGVVSVGCRGGPRERCAVRDVGRGIFPHAEWARQCDSRGVVGPRPRYPSDRVPNDVRYADGGSVDHDSGAVARSTDEPTGAEPLAVSDDLFAAIVAGDAAAVDRILAARPSAAGASDGAGLSALTVAAYHGRWPIVDRILAAGPDLDLFEAAIVGDAEMVRARLDEAEREVAVEAEASSRRGVVAPLDLSPAWPRAERPETKERSTSRLTATTRPTAMARPPRSTREPPTASRPSTSRPSSADRRWPGCSSIAAPTRRPGRPAASGCSPSTAPSPVATRRSRRCSSRRAPT